MRLFWLCITVTAVSLFYEVLPKQFLAFGFKLFQGKFTILCDIGLGLACLLHFSKKTFEQIFLKQ